MISAPATTHADNSSITLNVTASAGVCRAQPTDDLDTLLRRADVAMYHAKYSGGARHVHHHPGMAMPIPVSRKGTRLRDARREVTAVTRPRQMACRRCHQPLNTLGDPANPTYMHPAHKGPANHRPDPIPIGDLDTVDYVCDFCGDPQPLWSLRGGEIRAIAHKGRDQYVQDYGQRWSACAACEADAEAGRIDIDHRPGRPRPEASSTPTGANNSPHSTRRSSKPANPGGSSSPPTPGRRPA